MLYLQLELEFQFNFFGLWKKKVSIDSFVDGKIIDPLLSDTNVFFCLNKKKAFVRLWFEA